MAPLAEVLEIAASDDPTGSPPEEVERLRAENDLLRERLGAAETIASEREQRIDDLLSALRGLPGAWMHYLEQRAQEEPADSASTADGPARPPETVIEVLAAPSPTGDAPQAADPGPHPSVPPGTADPLDFSVVEAAWQEVRLLRNRLELRRLDRELERLRATRRRSRFRRPRMRRAS